MSPESTGQNRSASPRTFLFGQNTAQSWSFSSPLNNNSVSNQGPILDQNEVENDKRPSTPTRGGLTLPLFRFGGQEGNDAESSPFSFGSLHNMTPMPSPREYPQPHDQKTPTPLASPDSEQSLGASPSAAASGLSPPSFTLAGPSYGTSPILADRMHFLSIQPRSKEEDESSAIIRRIPLKGRGDTPAPIAAAGQDAPATENVPKIYNIRSETGPSHDFFTSKFQSGMKKGLNIAKDLVAVIENVGVMDDLDAEGQMLLTEAQDATSFQGSDRRRIAVLGDSGEGKSTLINSLLHFPGIARTGDIGSACTSVVTEYRHRRKGHRAPITIEAEYLSGTQIDSVVHELLWSYRQPYLPLVESSEISEQDYIKYQRESEYAWSALSAAFGHQRAFTKEMLRDMSDGAEDRLTDQLLLWARDIKWPESAKGGKWMSTAATADECVEKTRLFMQDKLWPFTKIIRVYISSQILKTGVVLADLPGLQDTNLARVRVTQDYLMSCDNIFVVARIQRAVTDQSVKSSLYWILSRHAPVEWETSGARNLKLVVVCTRSEEIDLNNAKVEFCGDGKRIATEQISALESEIEDAKQKNDRPRKKAAKRELEFLLMGARNEHVKDGLKKAYTSEAPDGNLEVFCVSNVAYEKFCRKGASEYVEASGIPGLRRFCHNVAADAQLREARHFLHSCLPGLLSSTGLWADSHLRNSDGSAQQVSASLIPSVETLTKETLQAVSQLRKEFIEDFNEQIMRLFAAYEGKWGHAAVAEAETWETWHWSQYNAWCLKDGNHSTPKRGHVNWNRDIIWKMRLETDYAWDLVTDEVHDVFKALTDNVTSGLSRLQRQVIESPGSTPLAPLITSIETMAKSFEYKLGLEQGFFDRGVRIIRRRLTDSHANSYIHDDMTPYYRAACNKTGTGKGAKQKEIVGGRISEGTIFACMAVRLQSEMISLAEETEGRLHRLTKEMMQRLKTDVDMTLIRSRADSRSENDCIFDRERLRLLGLKVDALKNQLATIDQAGK